MSSPYSQYPNEPIAIIGTGCRLPGGADSSSKLWELLRNPRDVSCNIGGAGRFNLDRFYHPEGGHNGTTHTQRGYLLRENPRHFDAKFFSIPPGEAEVIDPQQRMLLEVVYEALESAGLPIHSLSGSDTACYVGIMCQDFFTVQAQDLLSVPKYAVTGIAASNASSRVSYFFDWHGPSMTIDTACSSSMVCVNEAVQALRSGTSRVAVACGTNLLLAPFMYVSLSAVGMVSPTGRCHMWDERADGYARGEGVGALVLKTLHAAIEDGDDIVCIIREIGLNHDGRTKGLTMPSAEAQAALIRETYRRARLDPTSKSDRCQFFEAHGTGTPTGDPKEASALNQAFFPNHDTAEGELLVGSIKTVVGHTEGTAGIAGILKAALAVQHGVVLPNMLFNKLNPALEPFTKFLRIPTACEPWPDVPAGQPRRASINSFGFGGANAHCIIESYEPERRSIPEVNGSVISNGSPLIPLAFSAACLNSLISQVTQALEYLEQNPSIPLSSLAHTLSTRRSALSLRLPIYASSVPDLREKTQAKLAADDSTTTHSVAALQAPPSILGIFTGQGAQWMGMGAALFAANPLARDILDRLDAALASLPACHRPSWTLAELLSPVTSKLHHAHSMTEAAVAQPACTAVQIVLVDLLRAAGVRFAAVVGHSSGEIAAAYAAGFLSAEDAIRVAYYRGFFAKLAAGLAGEKGAMLAAGTDVEDAEELCLVDDMLGRLCVAAHNSPSSVTLSGDIDAVELARDVFEDEQKFARLLRVDTAYHSAHMRSCSGPYLKAMRDVGIRQLMPGPDRPRWFSSVYDAEMTPEGATKKGLDGRYWVDNMLRPVLFYPALKTCLSSSDITFNFALEVGPHPALQGPAKDCIQDVTQQDMAYTGTLRRGSDDAEAFADALGSLWARFGPSHVNLGGFQKKCLPDVDVRLAAALASKLPKYPWTHEKEYWAESRKSKIHSSDPGEFHDLLGLREPDGLADEVRWRHILSVNDLRWLAGHTLQRQVVFPATGYICMVGEAAMQIVQPTGLRVAWIDVLDLEIRKAIAVHQDYGTEVILCFSRVCPPLPDATTEAVTACFNIFSSPARDATQLALHCCGKVRITLVPSSLHTESGSGKFDYASIFPARRAPVPGMNNVDIDRFYQSMRDEVGLGWDGAFRGLTKIMRKGGYSTVTATNPQFSDTDTKLLFHPAMLDCALQGLNAAFAAPGDGSIWDLVAPTHIRRVTMVPELLKRHRMDEQVAIDCTATISPTDARAKISLTGDVEVYASASQDRDRSATKLIEMEGIRISPVAPPTAEHDRPFFQESIMCLDSLNAKVARGGIRFNPEEKATALDAERVAFYYLKKLYLKTTPEMLATLPRYRQCLLAEAGRVYHRVRDGEHGFAPPSWVDDTAESTAEVMSRYDPEAIDFITAKTVGENLLVPEVLSGEVNILQYMVRNDMLERWYSEGVGQRILNQIGTDLIAKLCHKYPRMNMLEIGAGTGGSTASILSRVGENFRRYTYTDISSAFFERAAERFHAHAHKMVFKTLDITRDPSSQGFTPQSYDVVVAQNVLHATAPLKESLRHARKLLRPGGYLMLLELLRSESMRFGLVVGCLPGWWVGEDDGRKGGPLLTMDEWQSILAETGFAVDTVSEVLDQEDVWAVLSARAVDEQMVPALINPLPRTLTVPRAKNLLIVGGNNAVCGSVSLRKQVASVVSPYFERVTYLEDVSTLSPDAEQDILAKKGLHVLNLCECDSNYWEDVTEPSFENLKRLFSKAASVLWLLQGCLDENPYAGATLGFLRTIRYEIPDTAVQMLDIGTSTLRDPSPSPDLVRLVSECMLRLAEASELEAAGKLNQILWSVEPELYLNESDGQLYVPRLRCADGPNLRYNAAKRPITQFVDISSESETPLDLVWDKNDSKYILLEQHEFAPATPNNLVTIRVSCSFLSSLKTPAGFFYICLGANTQTGLKTLCLSDRQSSILTVPRSWTVGLGTTSLGVEDLAFMSFVAVDLLAKRILELAATSHGSVAILDANPVAGALLYKRLTDVGKTVLLITSNQSSEGSSTVFLHPHSPQRAINTALPSDTTLFIDASITAGNPEASAKLASRIETMLPAVCDKIKLSAMMSREASTLPETAPESISTLLQSAASFATMFSQLGPMPIAGGGPLEVLPLPKLLLAPLPPKPTSLVYWQVEQELPVSVQPVFMRKDLFRPDRTYWLAGLSGTLGLSLVDFLAAHNAKHIAISSRSPSVDDSWVAWQAKKGVTVSHFAGDLTDYESVRKTYKSIRDSGMPPIGGVAVGAMVLIDSTFMEQRFEDFQAVLRPKAMGAMNLDRLFSKESADLLTGDTAEGLDWFIGFSSLMGTTGNPGQAPYGAGNCFLKAVTKRRHDRGLAGSSIDIGPLFGVGYIERALTRESQARLMQRSGTIPSSESDLHQLFAEAVVAGRPNSGVADPGLIAGLGIQKGDAAEGAFWSKSPRLSMMIRDEGSRGASGAGDAGSASVPVRKLLEEPTVKTLDDAYEVILGAIRDRLHASKFLPDQNSQHDTTPLVELGVDSLVAVNVRSWFQKELSVEVPVMKILGGASMADLVALVLDKLPQDILSRLQAPQQETQAAYIEVPVLDKAESESSVEEDVNFGQEANGYVNGGSQMNGGLGQAKSVIDVKVAELDDVVEIEGLMLDLD
ncbi:putative polyketide synthase [Canariomyces notabilis]|uniref:Polyketide synthase n=1 Tax=Canariomyces notabilis TaxID=2074819 RepID=A0AAN6T8I0_9PEZI|nr:putative polyketide synthase [Canariomyces arenarius]